MRKEPPTKLSLNKENVSNLNNRDMNLIKAATLALPSCACAETESCSLVHCCPPPKNENNAERDNG